MMNTLSGQMGEGFNVQVVAVAVIHAIAGQ